MKNGRVLLVDDELNVQKSVTDVLEKSNYVCISATDGDSALDKLQNDEFDLILLDIMLPGKTGMELIPDIKHSAPDTPLIMITGNAVINDAVKAIKMGAFNYIRKPFNAKELVLSVEKAIEWRRLIDENRDLKSEIESKFNYRGIIGKSKKIREVIATIKQISDTDVNVLITGESGTGKDLVAKAIHYSGLRKSEPFIPVNCSSLPDNLLESELFGYKKGAFTGAYSNKDGLFKVADKGTIFLDEIGDMPPQLQAKILKVLDSGEFIPLGSTAPVKTNARIISATNINLQDAIESGKFREDLFYRLNVVNIRIPPLRDRREDIIVLSDFFIDKYSAKMNKHIHSLSESAADMIMRYQWPGNVRELENVIESSCALSKSDEIDVKTLPDTMFSLNKGNRQVIPINKSLKETISYCEREYLIELLRFCKGNITKASDVAGIARQNFHAKLNNYNIEASDYRK